MAHGRQAFKDTTMNEEKKKVGRRRDHNLSGDKGETEQDEAKENGDGGLR